MTKQEILERIEILLHDIEGGMFTRHVDPVLGIRDELSYILDDA